MGGKYKPITEALKKKPGPKAQTQCVCCGDALTKKNRAVATARCKPCKATEARLRRRSVRVQLIEAARRAYPPSKAKEAASRARYEASARRKETRARYVAGEAGKAAQRRASAKYSAKRTAERYRRRMEQSDGR